VNLSRRALLASAIAATGALAAVAGLGTLPEAGNGLRVLSSGEARTCAALAEAMFPPGSALGISGPDVDVPARVDMLCAEVFEAEVVQGFRWALRVLDDGTLPRRGGFFRDLPLEVRKEVLATWADNDVLPRRLLHDLLRMALGIAFFSAPEVRRSLGYRPACGDPDAA
jgi:hypothetical protein